MATLNNAAFAAQNGSTDALCRVFWQAIHDFFATTCGLSLTSDTGQANLTTITRSASADAERGYEVFKLGDTLQATTPVFIRVGYRMGTNPATCTVAIQVSFATDGAGNLIGNKSTFLASGSTGVSKLSVGNLASAEAAKQAVGSGTTSRFCLAIGVDAATPAQTSGWVSLERTKDAAGADTATGVLFGIAVASGTVSWLYLPASGGYQDEAALTAIISNNTSSGVGSVIGFGRPIPLAGDMKYPGKNMVVYTTADYTGRTEVSLTVDGGAVNYYTLGDNFPSVSGIGGATKAANSRLGLRFD